MSQIGKIATMDEEVRQVKCILMDFLFENNILFVKRREGIDKRECLMVTLSTGHHTKDDFLTKKRENVCKSVGDDSKMHLIIFIALHSSHFTCTEHDKKKKKKMLNWSLSISKLEINDRGDKRTKTKSL